MTVWPVLGRSLMITGFVAVMMILVENLNVFTEGRWQEFLKIKAINLVAGLTAGGLLLSLGT